jgi:hypothetical protein
VPPDDEGKDKGDGADGDAIEEEEEEGLTPAEIEEKRHPTLPIRMQACQGMCCRVEIQYQDEWGTVCDDGIKQKTAEVVCRQLKCEGGEVVRSFGGGDGTIWMDRVNCAGDEPALSKCEFRGWGKHDCSHSHDVGVCCNNDCVAILKAKNQGGGGID